MMRLLVIGRSGQLAQELCLLCPQAVALGRPRLDLAAPGIGEAFERWLDALRPEAIVNAAAWTAVDAAEDAPEAAFRLNAEAPGLLARAAARRGIALVHLSTDYVFDGSGTRPWRPDDQPAPLSVYGRSKHAGEEAVRAAGGVHAVLRTSWVFSARGGNFVRTMLRLGREQPRLKVVADQIGGPTPADDLARACLAVAAALKDGAPGGTYHFAGAPDTSWAGFAREILARAGLPAEVEEVPSSAWPTPAPRPRNSRLDCSALEADFGIARPDWRAGLDRVLRALGEDGASRR